MDRKIEYEFTPVPRIVMKKLFKANLTIYENRVLRFIFNKMYDWGKGEDEIGIAQIVRGTGISARNVSKTLVSLKLRGIITREGCLTRIVEDVNGWNVTSTEKYILNTSTENKSYFSRDEKVTSPEMTTKETLKETKKEKGLSAFLREEKRKEAEKGLAMMREAIGKFPGK